MQATSVGSTVTYIFHLGSVIQNSNWIEKITYKHKKKGNYFNNYLWTHTSQFLSNLFWNGNVQNVPRNIIDYYARNAKTDKPN
jgi:hypothetical protein